jgi:poly-gamma-glutamate synthesis protein (capsule biosynthesis protein)
MPTGSGYWLLARDGGVFTFDAPFLGSAVGAMGEGRAAAAIVRSPTGRGYNVLAIAAAVRIGFAGDVHGVDRVAAFLARGGDPLAGMRPLLATNDANIVNLETTVGDGGSAQAKRYTFQSPPQLLERLRAGGVTVVNLANNHSLDFGAGALLETIGHARNAGLLVVGAGPDKAHAFAPAIVQSPAGSVAFLGFSQVVQRGWAATDHSAGVASAYDVQTATAAVRAARAQADRVVVLLHSGEESVDCPTTKQRSLSATLADNGADVVASSHPHVLQGLEQRGRALVSYSLGNFIWYSGNALTGLLSVDIGPSGVDGYSFDPARIDGTGTPQPLAGQPAADARAYVASLAPGAGRC